MAAYAIYRNGHGIYEVGPDSPDVERERVMGTATLDGANTVAAMWNETSERAATERRRRATGTDAPSETEQPDDTTPCAAPRFKLVQLERSEPA